MKGERKAIGWIRIWAVCCFFIGSALFIGMGCDGGSDDFTTPSSEISPTKPLSGYWVGDGILFVVSEDSKSITELTINYTDHIDGSVCDSDISSTLSIKAPSIWIDNWMNEASFYFNKADNSEIVKGVFFDEQNAEIEFSWNKYDNFCKGAYSGQISYSAHFDPDYKPQSTTTTTTRITSTTTLPVTTTTTTRSTTTTTTRSTTTTTTRSTSTTTTTLCKNIAGNWYETGTFEMTMTINGVSNPKKSTMAFRYFTVTQNHCYVELNFTDADGQYRRTGTFQGNSVNLTGEITDSTLLAKMMNDALAEKGFFGASMTVTTNTSNGTATVSNTDIISYIGTGSFTGYIYYQGQAVNFSVLITEKTTATKTSANSNSRSLLRGELPTESQPMSEYLLKHGLYLLFQSQ